MSVTVAPATFAMVEFDGARIADLVVHLLARLDMDPDTDVHIEVDETTPMGRVRLAGVDPITITAESGALEDPKRPRSLSDAATAEAIGRQLLAARDRSADGFGAPSFDDEVPGGVAMAWDVHCVARLLRVGYPVSRQRRIYHFRNRFGFTDVADDAFDRLWTGDVGSYDELVGIARGAVSEESAVAV